MILGIDEVGRGCLAGPLCVAAVAIEPDAVAGLKDSKLLSKTKRLGLSSLIKQHAAGIGLGWVSAKQIDSFGLSRALKIAAQAAVSRVHCPVETIIIDGTVNFLAPKTAITMKKADQLVPEVSAASIIAKVARDNYMRLIDDYFPSYGFKHHVGYGTATHLAALDQFGPCDLHRLSFAPLANSKPKTIGSGAVAEQLAAKFLASSGFKILDRNWKTKWCEIDIIAQKYRKIYFIEVKYRRSLSAGRGLEYITKTKLKQMKFAAEMWVKANKFEGPRQLAALEISGHDFRVSEFITEF